MNYSIIKLDIYVFINMSKPNTDKTEFLWKSNKFPPPPPPFKAYLT